MPYGATGIGSDGPGGRGAVSFRGAALRRPELDPNGRVIAGFLACPDSVVDARGLQALRELWAQQQVIDA
jgi:hypothetical protein